MPMTMTLGGTQAAGAEAEPEMVSASAPAGSSAKRAEACARAVLRVIGLLTCVFVFLLALDLMGSSFKCLGGRGAGDLFQVTDNPIAGLMVGILATVLVQSSSTSTSIVVGLVGAGQISVRNAVPIIMGANIGTSVTNTIVSMSQMGDRKELERAFAGATVHDMFNFLTVLVLLPLELVVGAIQGEGGPIYWTAVGLTDAFMGSGGTDATFTSPTKAIVGPVGKLILKTNKDLIKALSYGLPAELALPAGAQPPGGCEAAGLPADCGSGSFMCLASGVAKSWKKVDKKAFAALPSCEGFVAAGSGSAPLELCAGQATSGTCYLAAQASEFFESEVQGGKILKAGALAELGDVGGGIFGLVLSLVLLCGALFFLVKLLEALLMGPARRVIARAVHMNDYLAMMVGAGLTFLVQSSSVVTSVLTPLCGIGILPIEKMLPMTLGANVGTTLTAMLAAVSLLQANTISIALCHLFFNVYGILIWFPAPVMRKVPLTAALTLGLYASFYRFVPVLYVFVAFVILPGAALGISLAFDASVIGGVVLTLLALAAIAAFVVWWNFLGGAYCALSKETRELHDASKYSDNSDKSGEVAARKVAEAGAVPPAGSADSRCEACDQAAAAPDQGGCSV